MKLILWYSAIILAVCQVGCLNTLQGQKFDDHSVKSIRTGKTTKAEVLQMFGQPPTRQSTGGGNEVWIYQYFQLHAQPSASSFIPIVNMFASESKAQSNSQMLMVQFTRDIVSACTYNKSTSNSTANVGLVVGGVGGVGQSNNVTTPCEEAQ